VTGSNVCPHKGVLELPDAQQYVFSSLHFRKGWIFTGENFSPAKIVLGFVKGPLVSQLHLPGVSSRKAVGNEKEVFLP
jgi:hypothetical protein